MSTTTTTKYLLAKYIADLHRFEPRNVGVIVCSPTGAEARFAGEFGDRPGEVDGRSIPNFVTSGSAYRQWVRYWRDTIAAGRVTVPATGESVLATSPGFADALQLTSRGNFVVVDAGSVLDEIDASELPAVADQLYAQLVDVKPTDDPPDADLDAVADGLLKGLGLRDHRNFHRDYPVRCSVNGVEEEYVFSDAFGNGTPERLYQRLTFPKSKVRLRKNVHDTAWSFDQVIRQGIVKRNDAGVLVCLTDQQKAQPDVDRSLRLLESLTRIINLRDQSQAMAEFAPLAALPEH